MKDLSIGNSTQGLRKKIRRFMKPTFAREVVPEETVTLGNLIEIGIILALY
jgi:hypothetical protein